MRNCKTRGSLLPGLCAGPGNSDEVQQIRHTLLSVADQASAAVTEQVSEQTK